MKAGTSWSVRVNTNHHPLMGEVIAGPLYNEEGLIFAGIDLDDIVKARYDMDPTGHYSRPDVFELSVNEKERPVEVSLSFR